MSDGTVLVLEGEVAEYLDLPPDQQIGLLQFHAKAQDERLGGHDGFTTTPTHQRGAAALPALGDGRPLQRHPPAAGVEY
jgi:hypothetical protein